MIETLLSFTLLACALIGLLSHITFEECDFALNMKSETVNGQQQKRFRLALKTEGVVVDIHFKESIQSFLSVLLKFFQTMNNSHRDTESDGQKDAQMGFEGRAGKSASEESQIHISESEFTHPPTSFAYILFSIQSFVLRSAIYLLPLSKENFTKPIATDMPRLSPRKRTANKKKSRSKQKQKVLTENTTRLVEYVESDVDIAIVEPAPEMISKSLEENENIVARNTVDTVETKKQKPTKENSFTPKMWVTVNDQYEACMFQVGRLKLKIRLYEMKLTEGHQIDIQNYINVFRYVEGHIGFAEKTIRLENVLKLEEFDRLVVFYALHELCLYKLTKVGRISVTGDLVFIGEDFDGSVFALVFEKQNFLILSEILGYEEE